MKNYRLFLKLSFAAIFTLFAMEWQADAQESVTNLASNTAWTLSLDDGPVRPIRVTAGGWNSDQQDPQIPSAAAKDHVVYERQITIPAEAWDKTIQIQFGGCNYGAEVWLDDRKILEYVGPMTPFKADLSGIAQPGKSYRLRVRAYTRMHYGAPPDVPVGFDFNKGIPGFNPKFDGDTKFSYGLTGYVRLVLLPAVSIRDIFVRPSVAHQSLSCDVWISNSSRTARQIDLAGTFSSWNKKDWNYPALPTQKLEIPAGQTVKATWTDIPWTLGEKSYWWPNIPFHEDYVATLHWLNLTVLENGAKIDECHQRFGFVEHAEGPYYYTVNGVRYTSFADVISYGQVGEYDCWTETPCFQAPHGNVKGCPETWKRYQRIGFNSIRLSTSVPTEVMLDTADEAGYMLIPEGGSWGNKTCLFNRDTFSRQLQATIRTVRNHPSVSRYSLANESIPADSASPNDPWRWLIDAAVEADPTRPYVFEVNHHQTGMVPGMHAGHAAQMQHYDPIVPGGDHIRGMGECAWSTDGMTKFAQMAVKMRLDDWAHFAPWDWINYWPNFLEGMNHDRHPWKRNDHADRTDAIDGWNSQIVESVQRALNPFLIQDRQVLGEKPGLPSTISSGQSVERSVEVFNGAIAGNQLTLTWSAHWDKPDGPLAVNGGEISCEIEPGFHAPKTISFLAPPPEGKPRELYLVMESHQDGQTVFREEGIHLTILPLMGQ
jgi:hypothetical protein